MWKKIYNNAFAQSVLYDRSSKNIKLPPSDEYIHFTSGTGFYINYNHFRLIYLSL